MPDMHRMENGHWEPAQPLGYIGWKAMTADWFRRHHLTWIAKPLERLDERGLGR